MRKNKQRTYNLHAWYGDLLVSLRFESERPDLEGPDII